MASKVQRQQAIGRLIGKQAVTNQPQLVELLAVEGIAATQATVSRDLEDLGAVKVRVPGGETVYAIPEYEPARIAPQDQLRRVMGEWVAEVRVSSNVKKRARPLMLIRSMKTSRPPIVSCWSTCRRARPTEKIPSFT